MTLFPYTTLFRSKITELPDTFTGGKNSFLIAGSDLLVADTKILIEIKSSDGSIIYNEPGEGLISSSLNGETFVTEYYEGVSKVVAVYVYPDTNFGECTITILGEVSSYDNNGLLTPIPLDWEGKYNVKWQKTINVNPSLANTTKIRFYQRPTANITEILSPIYRIVSGSKVESAVTQSFANIKLSNLETFAGDVKRVKVFRTSTGDISDYDLIQDILVESKELLTSTGSFFTGSVVGNTGTFTTEVLKNQWNSGSLNATLNSTRVEAGVRLTGSGLFTYTQSLDLKSTNTYELNLDAFYSSSTNSNLGIYLLSGSTSSSITTLVGTQPTKNLLDTTIPFKIDRDYPTASLYFSQSQGQWHLGNVSLKLSEDTAFSPDEIGFITTMPTVLGNETFNFKFEFYDVNNNYVPVAVTQSATFNGGNTNIGGTILLISSSTSQSLADLNRVSSSISGTIVVTSGSVNTLSGSVSGSITTLSSSVSGTIGSVSSSVSGTIGVLSGSVSGTIGVLSGSVSGTIGVLSGSLSASIATTLSSSFAKVQQLANGGYPGTFISNDTIFSPVIGGQLGYISSLFKVGTTPSIYLDARQSPRKIFIGGIVNPADTIFNEYSGAFNNTNTNVYLDSTGKFSLKDKLVWDGTTLSIIGNISVGSTVPNSAITGLGSLALSSSVSTQQMTGLGALATRNNVNLSLVTDAGAMAAINSITAGNATTYIGSGAIVSNFIAANTIVAGNIAGNTITADQISGLNFTGKTATFDKGSIGGWDISNNAISKSVGGVGRMVLKSSDNTISMFDTNENLRLQLNPSTTLPTFASPNTTTTIDALSGVSTTTGTFPQAYVTTATGTNLINTRPSNAISIVLSGTLNEIFIGDLVDRWYDTGADPDSNMDYFFYKSPVSAGNVIGAKYTMTAVVSGPSGTFSVILGYAKGDYNTIDGAWFNSSVYTNPAVFSNLAAGTYSIYIEHQLYATKILTSAIRWYPWSNSIGGTRPDGSTSSTITITYGTSTAYSVLNAGGVVFYNGSRNIFKISQPTTIADSFFQVTGKSQFNTSLYVSGALAADSKQFQITHPLNDNKWLYHSAIEGPGAYLIYKGTLELQNGVASASIDLLSKMTDGTFESLVRRTQFFVQNNSSWDLVRGRLGGGVVYIESNNNNSTASVDWMVVGERKDNSILNSILYDNDGNYKPEKYKSSAFLKYVDYEIESGSI
jgi:hypothetical protein